MKFRLITVVWGKNFTDVFLRVTVRSLLSEGNLATLAARHEVIHSIHTTEQDAAVLRASPIFQRLTASAPVEIAVFDPSEIDLDNPSTHWVLWRRAAKIAKERHEFVFFIIPDHLIATGTLVRWAGFFERGYRAVWTAIPQVALETVVEELEQRFAPEHDPAITLDPAEINRLLIRQMHPIMITMFRDSRRWIIHPEIVFLDVPGQGLAMRAIGSHPFCIDVEHFAMSDAFCPLNRFEDIAFDRQLQAVSLERVLKYADLYYRPKRMDEDRLSNLGHWLDMFCTPGDMLESRHTYRFIGTNPVNEREFQRAAASLGFYASQARLAGAIYRVLRAMREAGCGVAAQVVATAHYAGRLRRHWSIKGAVTVFVPADAAMAQLAPGALDALLAVGNEKALVDAVLGHVFADKLVLSVGDELAPKTATEDPAIATANGAKIRTDRVVPAARIMAGPIEVNDCVIYVIDRPLWPVPGRESPPRAGRSVLPNRWTANPQKLFAWQQTPVAAPHSVPLQRKRFMAAVRLYATTRLRRLYHVMLSHPLLRPVALRAAGRTEPGRRERELAAAISALVPGRGAEKRARATIETSAIETFHRLQGARVALNLAELLRFHRSKVGDIASELRPLAAVEDCLGRASITEERLITELRKLVGEAPDFAEAWLELGYAQFDRGTYADAIACFDRCLTGTATIAVGAGRMACHAQAAFAKARTLETEGKLEAAAAAYAAAFAFDGAAPLMHVARAKILRRLGRVREALPDFDYGTHIDSTTGTVAPLPRHFSTFAEQLVARFSGADARIDEHAARSPNAALATASATPIS